MNATAPKISFGQIGACKTLSQLIRSNAPSYWSYMKHSPDLGPLQKYLGFEGIIAGDPHPGNFGPIPVRNLKGQRAMKFLNIDFDDCGIGPFALDYVRYVVAVKADSKLCKWRPLQEAYLAGLTGKKLAAPREVQKFLAMKLSAYDKKASAYMVRNTTSKGFKFKKGETQPYKGRIDPAVIMKLFPSGSVVGMAKRIESRGGSEDMLRIWVLVAGERGARRIVELKQRSIPGTESYRPQPPVKQWLSEVREVFWSGLDGSSYDLITVAGELFWIRDKHVSLINLPYSSRKKRNQKFLVDLAVYDANVLGLAHGTQPGAKKYLRTISNDPEKFHQVTKQVGNAYLKLAEEALRRRLDSLRTRKS